MALDLTGVKAKLSRAKEHVQTVKDSAYPVSTRVNSVANDDPQCAEIAVVHPGDTKNAQLWLANVDIP